MVEGNTASGTSTDTSNTSESEQSFSRRTVLKVLGATTAAVATTSSLGPRIRDGDWIDRHLSRIRDGSTLKIPPGTYKFGSATIDADRWTVDGQGCTFDVQSSSSLSMRGSAWNFGNVRFDVNPDQNVQVFPYGNDWRLHHCAWDGKNGTRQFLVLPRIDSEDAVGTIEKCWFGSGTAIDPRTGRRWNESAIKGTNGLRGDLYVRGCYFWQNGSYLSPTHQPYANGHRGKHVYENCFAKDCYLAFCRIGTPYEESIVDNCVGVYSGDRGNIPPTADGQRRSRGVWVSWGPALIRNSHLSYPDELAVAVNGDSGGTARVENSEVVGKIDDGVETENVGSDPDTTPPEGCVTSPDDAVFETTWL